MPTPREVAVADLRRAIDVLPERTRQAMLVGLQTNTVITGAFTGGDGVCPMMAAHREGGRTSCVSFPEAWDKFTGVYGRAICRQATEYEVGILRMEIQASLKPQVSDLAEAIADHEKMVESRRRRDRFFAGDPVDLAGTIDEHKSSARRRRSSEADDVGLDWLFEETLVLPADFGTQRVADADADFDFDAAEDDVYAR
ncbi:MAG TPA: hypothetical protein VMY78_15310 [Solirubrobacteraceae bacterium]|nr:hypothetical protein [Solirubrobacteraceae bacterium]